MNKAGKADLRVTVAGLQLQNPVMPASGTFGYGQEYAELLELNRLGALITKGVSLRPLEGNPPPRICETPSGMLNAIGLQNIGVKAFIAEKLPFLASLKVPVIVNVLGHTFREYQEVVSRLTERPGVAAFEINISCPNVQQGGLAFGTKPKTAFRLISGIRKRTRLPLVVKLTPQVTDIGEMARAVEEAGADAVSLINTIPAMAVDIHTRRSKLGRIHGGLSGPAIRPIALRLVFQAVQAVAIPVIGVGGILTAEDALEFLIVGAMAVQIGTANFVRPTAVLEIIEGIAAFLTRNKIPRVTDLIGTFLP